MCTIKLYNPSFAVEDLDLTAVESLHGVPFLAVGKHLCGAATGNFGNLGKHSNEIYGDCFIDENMNDYAMLFFLISFFHSFFYPTDLALRCCFPEYRKDNGGHCTADKNLGGLAIATCCHHLCQWKHYISNNFLFFLTGE